MSTTRCLRRADFKWATLGIVVLGGACKPNATPPTDSTLTIARSALTASTPTISAEIGTDAPVLGPSLGGTTRPAAAFDGTNYLVVWSDDRSDGIDPLGQTTGPDIYGIRVAPDGTVIDATSFPIAVAAGSQTSPQVVFDGTNWMVVWSDARDPSGYAGTYGARVATAGTVLDPQGIPLFPSTSAAATSAPAGLDTDGTHVVLTTIRNDGIYASVLQSDGTVLGSPFQVAPVGGGGAIAFDGTNHLVLYGTSATPPPVSGYNTNVFAQRFTSAGALVGGPISLLTGSLASPSGMPTAVATSGNGWVVAFILGSTRYGFVGHGGAGTLLPSLGGSGVAIALDFWGNGYTLMYTTGSTYHALGLTTGAGIAIADQILFSNQTPSDIALLHDPSGEMLFYVNSASNSNMYGTRLSPTLGILDSPGFLLSREANVQAGPSLAYNGAEYLVAWADYSVKANGITTSEIESTRATRLSTSGQVLDSPGLNPFPLSTPSAGFFVGAASNGTDFTVTGNVYGALSAAGVTAAGASGTTSALPTASSFYGPQIVSDGSNYLVAWIKPGVGLSGPLMGARVSSDGKVLDTTPFTIAASVSSWALAFNGTSYLVAYVPATGNVYGARLDKTGHVLDNPATSIAAGTSASDATLAVGSDGAEWLVAWASGGNLRAARVDASGQLIDRSGISIATQTVSQLTAKIAWDRRRYWVIWTDDRTPSTLFPGYAWPEVYGARMTSGGTVDDPGGILLSGGQEHVGPTVVGGDHQILIAYYRMMAESPIGAPRVRERLISDPSLNGEPCAKDSDCQSGTCATGACQPVASGTGGAGGGGVGGAGGGAGTGGGGLAGRGGSAGGMGGSSGGGGGSAGSGGSSGGVGGAAAKGGASGHAGGGSGGGGSGGVGGSTGAGGSGTSGAGGRAGNAGGMVGAGAGSGGTTGVGGIAGRPDAGSVSSDAGSMGGSAEGGRVGTGGGGGGRLGATADSGVDAHPTAGGSGSGCSCSTDGGSTRDRSGSALLAALALGWVLRRQRPGRKALVDALAGPPAMVVDRARANTWPSGWSSQDPCVFAVGRFQNSGCASILARSNLITPSCDAVIRVVGRESRTLAASSGSGNAPARNARVCSRTLRRITPGK